MDEKGQSQDRAVEDGDHVIYTPGYQDLLAANRLHYRPTRRGLATDGLLMGAGAANVVLSLLGPGADRDPYLWFGIALILIAPLCRALVSFWLLPAYTRRYVRQAAILREEFTVSWSEAGLDSRTRRTSNFVPWEDYVGRREDAATLLFYQTDVLFQFIPKRALRAGQVPRLRSLAGAVPERRWVSPWPKRSKKQE
jgi:hypothetical protein